MDISNEDISNERVLTGTGLGVGGGPVDHLGRHCGGRRGGRNLLAGLLRPPLPPARSAPAADRHLLPQEASGRTEAADHPVDLDGDPALRRVGSRIPLRLPVGAEGPGVVVAGMGVDVSPPAR